MLATYPGQRVHEEDLFERARNGDAEALVQLLEPLAEPAHRLATGLLHDPSLAEDAVQEAAVKAWRHARRLRPRSSVRPWFLAIVANQCRDLRRRRWFSVIRQAEPGRQVAAPDSDLAATADLRRALARLPHQQRLAVVLTFYLDLPLEEVAAVVGISVGAARSRLYRGLARLRPLLEMEPIR